MASKARWPAAKLSLPTDRQAREMLFDACWLPASDSANTSVLQVAIIMVQVVDICQSARKDWPDMLPVQVRQAA